MPRGASRSKLVVPTEDGFLRFQSVLQKTNFVLTRPKELSSWLLVVKDHRTAVMLTCSVCGACCSAEIGKFTFSKASRCFCNGKVRVHERAFYDDFCNALRENGRLVLANIDSHEQWQQLVTSRNVSIAFKCTTCGDVASKCIPMRNKWKEMGMQCSCNGQLSYAGVDGRRHFLDQLNKTRFVLRHQITATEWTSLGVTAQTKLPLTCSVCGLDVESKPMNIRVPQGIGCLCTNSTEAVVYEYVCAVASDFGVSVGTQIKYPDRLRGVGGKPLSFDMSIHSALQNATILIEVDGGHHFGGGFSTLSDRNHTEEHDLIKERFCIQNGLPLIRLEVDTVRFDRVDWRSWLSSAFRALLSSDSSRMLICLSSSNHYRCDRYVASRLSDSILRDHVLDCKHLGDG